ncbi:MAG TPA: universal stress protein [Bryobacteraceae bacterium]|jgi:nucleotide-binding universal stress UspA family protein|nr:universal stress protein [Bryobacteraceae bacterium]
MFNHILFPIDFSERSRALNKQVEWLAARFGSRVTLMHIFEIPFSWYAAGEASFVNMECFDQLRESAEQRLKDYAIDVPEGRLQRIIAEGNAAPIITDWVNKHDVDLIVMATHGYGPLGGWLLGSVAGKVLHSTNCPVWTESQIRATPHGYGISKIMCAIEMISEAVPLLQFTGKLAQTLNATVQLIHCVPEDQTIPNRHFDFDLHRRLMDAASVEIAKLQTEAGTDFPLTVSKMEISDAVPAIGSEEGIDLVVIGRGRMQRPVGRFQSHAHNIVRHAPCPVLSYSLNQHAAASSPNGTERQPQFVEA